MGLKARTEPRSGSGPKEPGTTRSWGRLIAALAILASAAPASADLPPRSRLAWTGDGGETYQSLTLEFAAVAVLGANRLTGYPELGKLSGGEPEMIRLRIGAVGDNGRFGYAARVDIAETLRIGVDQLRFYPATAASRLIDDLYGLWRPAPGLALTAGRQRVGTSRFRSVEVAELPAGAAPFAIERAIPDRRWGARARQRLGPLTVGAGGWVDGDSIEPRVAPNDPSFEDRGMISAELEWAIAGDGTGTWHPERGAVAADPALDDPSLDEPPSPPALHVVARAAPLVRIDDATRVDAVLGAEARFGRYGGLLELLWLDGDLGAAGEGELTLHPKVGLFTRGEIDGERRLWAAGGGVTYYPTVDRRNRISIYGWVRRELDPAPARDGVVLQLGAAL